MEQTPTPTSRLETSFLNTRVFAVETHSCAYPIRLTRFNAEWKNIPGFLKRLGRGRSRVGGGCFRRRYLCRKSLDRIQTRGAEGRDHSVAPSMKVMVTFLIERVIDFAYCFAFRLSVQPS
jgi:hypothetical protein